jgi:hypothetical protein
MEMNTLSEIVYTAREMWSLRSSVSQHEHRNKRQEKSLLMSVMQSSPQVVPLLLSSSDYSLVGVMLREQNWRIVCACEKSHSEFVAEVRSKAAYTARESKKRTKDLLQGETFYRVYSKLLAMLEERYSEAPESHARTGWYPHYRQLLSERQSSTTVTCITVALKNLFEGDALKSSLRTWDDSFRPDLQYMRAVCSESSGYWPVITRLAKVRDQEGYDAIFQQYESMEDQCLLRTAFVLYAMKSKDFRSHGVESVSRRRKQFLQNWRRCLHELACSEDLSFYESEDAWDLADIMILTFFRVGTGPLV